MDKFAVKRSGKTTGYKPVVVDAQTYEKLAQIKEDTGISMVRLLAQMVDFCAERLEVSED